MKHKWLGGILFSFIVVHQLLGGEQVNPRIQSPSHHTEKHHQDRTVSPVPRIHQSNAESRPATLIRPEDSRPTPTQQQELHFLPIDGNSTIASDIVKIWHEPDSMAICVALKQNARCPHPAFLGRLSGPALAILEWTERPIDDADSGTVYCGGYSHNWLDAGHYFVEIIILHCKDFGVTALKRTNDLTEWLEAEHTLDCVEDAKYNRITSKEGRTVIQIPTSIEGKGSYRWGRWIRKHHLPLRALFTRYQPLECAGTKFGGVHLEKGSQIQLHCKSITARDHMGKKKGEKARGLFEYEFQWKMKVSEQELLEKLRERQHTSPDGKSPPKLCAVGDSHSRYMHDRSLPKLNITGLFDYVKSPWIHGIASNVKKHKCDVLFVLAGLYPASFATSHPYSFGKYHRQLKQQVQSILKFNPNAIIYLPTIDQGPLMARINQCTDWRTPTMLDGYSYVNQMIEKELNTKQVKYLDTNFIIYSHWDGHHDWQHLLEIVRSRKTIYIAAIMLGETEWFE